MVVRLRHRLADRGQHRLSRDPLRPQPHPAHRRRLRKDLSSFLRDGLTSCSPGVCSAPRTDAWLMVDCVRLSRSAARWKSPQSATATKARNNSKSSIPLILFVDQSYYEISFL